MTRPAAIASPPLPALQSEEDLAALLRDHGPAVRGLLVRRFMGLLREADLEDVIIVALQRLWLHRTRFDGSRGSLRAWFYRIADHAAQDLLKHGWLKARQLETALLPEQQPHDPAAAAPPEAHPATRQRVHEAMSELPEVQRRILWADALCPDGGPASSDWLAAELGIPPGTVRVYRKRGLEKLRALLIARGLQPDRTTHSRTP